MKTEFHHNSEATMNLKFSGFNFQLYYLFFSLSNFLKSCSVLILSPGTVKLDTFERSFGSHCGSPRPLVQQCDFTKVVRGPKLADLSKKSELFVKKNKLQKLEDALVKQMLTAADRADQA